MTDEDKIERHKKICDGIHELYKRKNKDYGDSFSESIKEFGEIAPLVRVSDKYKRIKTLTLDVDEREVDDETKADTLLDLAGYCIMWAEEIGGSQYVEDLVDDDED